MKKIGILTFPRSENYGAFLQCYSLYMYLKKNYPKHTYEVIDYTRAYVRKMYNKNFVISVLKNPKCLCSRIKKKTMFKDMLDYLNMSEERLISDDVKAFEQRWSEVYDVIIVGSDVVWKITDGYFPSVFWLSDKIKAKKFAYAVSCHGTDIESVSSKDKEYCKYSLEGFSYVGVRDESTEMLIQTIDDDIPYHHNCDPTLLIDISDLPTDKETLRGLIEKSKGYDSKKKNIGLMLSEPYITKLIIDRYSSEYNIVSVYTYNPLLNINLCELDVFQWANIFSFFDLTITTFFHGSVFSLKNNTPVIAINPRKFDEKYVGKTEDLLKRINRIDCFFHLSEIKDDSKLFLDKTDELLRKSKLFDVSEILREERRTSDSFFDVFEKMLDE